MEYFKKENEFTHDSLFAGTEVDVIVETVPISAKEDEIKRGTLIGMGGDGKYYVLGLSVTDSDDEELEIVPYGVLAEDISVSETEQTADIYITGVFNKDAVILAEGASLEDYIFEFRKLSIYFKSVQN